MSLCIESKALHAPDLEKVAKVLQGCLSENFSQVEVSVVDCPDLTEAPFSLASPGLCGKPKVVEVGGIPNLVPLVQNDKKYDLKEVAELVGHPNGFIIGPGAGDSINASEMMANVKFATESNVEKNGSYICKVNIDNSYTLDKSIHTQFGLMANLFASEGNQGKVIEVKASQRSGAENFVSCMRKGLAAHYGHQAVGVGGAFLIKKGKAKMHIMPPYSKVELKSEEDINKWLNFYEMSSPLVCLSVFVSVDPGLDLRLEHTHCFSNHNDGGHYHYDTTPDVIEYVGYFNLGESIDRIDRPKNTHNLGR